MSSSEESWVRSTLENNDQGTAYGRQLVYDPDSKRIVSVGQNDPDGNRTRVAGSDLGHYVA